MTKPRRVALAIAILCGLAAPAASADPRQVDTYNDTFGHAQPSQGVQHLGYDALTATPCVVGKTATCVPDASNAPFWGEVALVVGTPDTQARRSLKAICTGAGNVAVTYADSSTGVWAAQVGTQTWPIAITQVNTSGTTATCTYSNLK